MKNPFPVFSSFHFVLPFSPSEIVKKQRRGTTEEKGTYNRCRTEFANVAGF
jgi:hypothetical protein